MTVNPVSSVKDDLIEESEKLYTSLVASEKSDRMVASILSGALILLGSAIIILASDVTARRLTDYFIHYGSTFYFEIAGMASIFAGLIYYSLAKRRKSKYAELKQVIEEAKSEGQSSRETALRLISKVTSILPTVRDGKRDTAFFYGVLTFFLVAFLFPFNLILALAVWLYFRYEATSEFERKMTKFDNWKVKFQSIGN